MLINIYAMCWIPESMKICKLHTLTLIPLFANDINNVGVSYKAFRLIKVQTPKWKCTPFKGNTKISRTSQMLLFLFYLSLSLISCSFMSPSLCLCFEFHEILSRLNSWIFGVHWSYMLNFPSKWLTTLSLKLSEI